MSALKPLILSLDIATSTGVCLGRVGDEKPMIETLDMRLAGTARPLRLLFFAQKLQTLFSKYPIEQVRYESPMPIAVAARIGATEETMLLLRGLIGVLECESARAGIEDIGSFSVQDVRKHITGQRTFKKGTAKAEITKYIRALGFDVKGHDQADAVGGWLLCCALANPRVAHLYSPLFA